MLISRYQNMTRRILLSHEAPGHTRLLEFGVAPNGLMITVKQTTGSRESLNTVTRIRLARGQSLEQALEQGIIAEVLAAGATVVELEPEDPGFLERISAEVERRRELRSTELVRELEALEREGMTVTRGSPLTDEEVSRLESSCGVPFPMGYRQFLRTFGNLHIDADGAAALWILGAPMKVDESVLDPQRAAESFAPKLAARRADWPEPNPDWATQPGRVVPLLTLSPDLQYVTGVDAEGRIVEADLRYAELAVMGEKELWADFEAAVLREFGRLRGELKSSREDE